MQRESHDLNSKEKFSEGTHPGLFLPINYTNEDQFKETAKGVTSGDKDKIFHKIEKCTKYNNPQILYSFESTIITLLLVSSVILILAACYLYDSSTTPVSLPSPAKASTSHSSTCSQVEDTLPKEKTSITTG